MITTEILNEDNVGCCIVLKEEGIVHRGFEGWVVFELFHGNGSHCSVVVIKSVPEFKHKESIWNTEIPKNWIWL